MDTHRYNRLARYLHWISAAVIIWASLSGFYLATLDQCSPVRAWLSWFNVSLTTVFAPVFAIRVIHACRSEKPVALAVPRWQQRIAMAVHTSLYALTFLVLASGILMMDHSISIFGLLSLPNPVKDAVWNQAFYAAHRQSCAALFILVLVHVAAVAQHHLSGRRILARMT